MISKILPSKLTSPYQKKKLVSLENCYMHLKPYFKLRKSAKKKRMEKFLVEKKMNHQEVNDKYGSIEQNQILYARILTEKLLKV